MLNVVLVVVVAALGLAAALLGLRLERERRRYLAARQRFDTDVVDMAAEIQRQMEIFRQAERQRLLDDERNRIMRDVHDGLGGLLIHAVSLVEQGECTPELNEVLTHALTDLRLIVSSLGPNPSRLAALVANYRHLHTRLNSDRGCEFSWRIDSISDLDISPTRSLMILRILQEALTNVSKHARATRVSIAISQSEPKTLYLTVKDNGVGIDAAEPDRSGRGLANMRSRAASLGGTLEIRDHGHGTVVSLVLPAEAEKQTGSGPDAITKAVSEQVIRRRGNDKACQYAGRSADS